MKRVALAVCFLTAASAAWAQTPVGSWVQRGSNPLMMMTIELAGVGVKITYRMLGPDGNPMSQSVMTVTTALDGSEAPMLVDGKPSGQTMAIRRLDATHAASVVKFQGNVFGTSKSELSADGKTMKVENDYTASAGPNSPTAKQVEFWDRR